ncbi:MAG TPA: electron transfer flavoprotein subunit alpha [Thermodesulfobacteriaceae bacterium]|nr:electron transfer flavoprotein subunit alpha [Thermodesulfobacteriaceae bacterium]
MLIVHGDRCIGCGECDEACSFDAIQVQEEIAVVDPDSCTMCGTCVDVCPEEALELVRDEGKAPGNFDDWRGVWVAAEYKNGEVAQVTLELLAEAGKLAGKMDTLVTAVLMGHGASSQAEILVAHGADRVLVADHPELEYFTDEVYGNILADFAAREKPEIILAGATAMGRSYIPRVATILKTGLTADCTELDIRPEDRSLLQTRPAFGGNLLATIICPNHRPQMATVRPHVMKAAPYDADRKGEIIEITPDPALLMHSVRVVESVKEQVSGPRLSEAEVIVTAGRGIEEEKNIELVRELSDLLGGSIGATRAVTDAEWLPEQTQIGQTGVTVSPKLYIACGVSGAIQHVVGIQGSEIIVAVNKDESAPIFDFSTYGIEGDTKEIL